MPFTDNLHRSSPYTILLVDEAGRVIGGEGNVPLKDPTGYKTNEAHFEASTEPRQNPLRLKAGCRLTKVVPLPEPYEQDEEGNDITEETVVIPWTDCIMDNFAVREMTEQEKTDRDTYYAEQAAAKEAAHIATLVPVYGEKVGQLAALLSAFGLSMPINEDDAAAAMYAAVEADVTLTAKSQMAMVIYNDLRKTLTNDDIYGIEKVIGIVE